MKLTASVIRDYSAQEKHLHDEIHRTFQFRDCGKKHFYQEWKDACDAWHNFKSPLAKFWTDDFKHRVQNGNRTSIQELITLLEVDPDFFRSGYLKERLLRIIKNAPRNSSDNRRLLGVIWNRANGANRREFKDYCRLALKIKTPAFTEQVRIAAQKTPGNWNKFSFLLKYLDPQSK